MTLNLDQLSAFPAVRVEIDLEEWRTQRSACPTLRYTQLPPKKEEEEEESFLNVSLAYIIICRGAGKDRGVVSWTGALVGFF